MIERTFEDVPEGKLKEADQQSFLVSLGWPSGTTWQDLLHSRRVLLISEAGAGKTYECGEQARFLRCAGEPAFYVDLSRLAAGSLQDLLDDEEEARLEAWLASQSDVATFFLDSIDELRLSIGSFEQALKRLKKVIARHLSRARIVITTRPIPFDEQLVRQLLPVPPAPSTGPNEETFAKVAMGVEHARRVEDGNDAPPADWRTVALMPLSDAQISEFAKGQSVEDPDALLEDLKRRNAQEFARRPQDLIELCADWREHKRIRTHRDQVAANVRVKLQPAEKRSEPAELSVDKATEGASRLALAMLVMRRMTIRHSAASDRIQDEVPLDPAIILLDWNPSERKALLERPLFGFASYGRVRFHHRSVAEYLAAERLRALRDRGMPFSALKRLLFAETCGITIVRPSRRPVAGWLALAEDGVFETLRDNEPAVLVDEGDPETLSQSQRNQVLRAFVERHGRGGWRGLTVPHIQVHRFASPELAVELGSLWRTGIENPEVRQTLLFLIAAGPITDCADIAHDVARDAQAAAAERMIAVEAMVAIGDPRVADIATELADGDAAWPDGIARSIVLRLFPGHLSIDRLCQTLRWVKEPNRDVGDLSWQLPRLIANSEFDAGSLEALCDGLAALLRGGLRWRDEWPHVVCDRPHLADALAATCQKGLDKDKTDRWLQASVLALRLQDLEYGNSELHKALLKQLANLPADENERLFWAEDSLVQSLHPTADPWERYAEVVLREGPVELRTDRDLEWIQKSLGDRTRSPDDRAMLLQADMRLPPDREQWRDHLAQLKPLVSDRPDLVATIDDRLKPPKRDEEHERWEKEHAERQKRREQQNAESKASWIRFWREVADHPDNVFSSERSQSTAWDLWSAMRHDGDDSRASGWNRRFIEEHFGTETADRLRRVLMDIWRQDKPTLPSERPEHERNTYLVWWQLGLAALYAEAEDPSWAVELTEDEAEVAARYAPIELNGLPTWIESLVGVHPAAVDAILGEELSWELEQSASSHDRSILLQDISYASTPVASQFLPRLRDWLETSGSDPLEPGEFAGAAERLRQVIDTVLTHGDEDARAHVLAVAKRRLEDDPPEELALVWLPTIMRIDAELGVAALEYRIRAVDPGARTEAVRWFGVLFGDFDNVINLKTPTFTPQLLLRLLRLAYRHVRPDDDAERDRTSQDFRYRGERARNQIVNALLDAKAEDGYAAKLEMADDRDCAHFRDRILAVAQELWAQEIDSTPFDEKQAVELDRKGEAPASTNEQMFAIMNDRLSDIDELLLRDTSPREAWAAITKERVLRREIARELRNAAKGLYTVDQEAVTADEKETDIRLRSVVSDHEAVIELKRAEAWSAGELRAAIHDQLVERYMWAENTASGCLLVSIAEIYRQWRHPDAETLIAFPALVSLLREEAERVVEVKGGRVALSVHILDLRSRLPREKA